MPEQRRSSASAFPLAREQRLRDGAPRPRRLPVSADISLATAWGPSGDVSLLLQNVLALTNLGKTSVAFRFSPIGSATVTVDDVYVDPIFHE